jgi:hypothetical protein
MGAVGKAARGVGSFDRFCLAAGIDALGAMMEKDAEEVVELGTPAARTARTPLGPYPRQDWLSCRQGDGRAAARARPRGLAGAAELGWRGRGGLAGKWAMNLMLINVSTRKFRRRYGFRGRCPGADRGRRVEVGGLTALRGVVGCTHEGMDGADLSGLDIMVVQIDGIHISEHLVLVAASGSIARASSTRSG